MITVTIYINSQPIYTRSARNVAPEGITFQNHEGMHEYDVDDGTHLKHKRSDGAVKLAIKMLKTIKEP